MTIRPLQASSHLSLKVTRTDKSEYISIARHKRTPFRYKYNILQQVFQVNITPTNKTLQAFYFTLILGIASQTILNYKYI